MRDDLAPRRQVSDDPPVRLTLQRRKATTLQQWIPMAFPLALVGLQVLAEPDWDQAERSVPVAILMAGCSFDLWALTTILSGRYAALGGLFDLPSDEIKRTTARVREWAMLGTLIFIHIAALLLVAKRAWIAPIVSVTSGLLGPVFLLRPFLLNHIHEEAG